MKAKRKRHNAEFKFMVALEAAKELKTMSELASQFGLHPNQISEWKKSLLEGGSGIFKTAVRDGQREDLTAGVYEQLGRTQMELEWLKKKYADYQSRSVKP